MEDCWNLRGLVAESPPSYLGGFSLPGWSFAAICGPGCEKPAPQCRGLRALQLPSWSAPLPILAVNPHEAMRWIVPCFLLSQAWSSLSSDLCSEEQFIEELISCFVLLARILISCTSSLDFYNQECWQVKPLGSVGCIVAWAAPKTLESIKAVMYSQYSSRFYEFLWMCEYCWNIKRIYITYWGTVHNILLPCFFNWINAFYIPCVVWSSEILKLRLKRFPFLKIYTERRNL